MGPRNGIPKRNLCASPATGHGRYPTTGSREVVGVGIAYSVCLVLGGVALARPTSTEAMNVRMSLSSNIHRRPRFEESAFHFLEVVCQGGCLHAEALPDSYHGECVAAHEAKEGALRDLERLADLSRCQEFD